MHMRAALIALAAACLPVALGCTPDKAQLPVVADSVAVPYQEFVNATLFSYQGSVKKWKLNSAYMRKPLVDTGVVLVVPVVLSLFDSLDHASTRVLSDSGTTTPKMQSFTIWGDVYVRTREGLTVRTERLSLNNDTRMWHSDTFVQLQTVKGDYLRGKGFDATEDFSRSTFKQNVTGRFPQFRERMGKDDDIF
jgi:LPS export ABC transporter protein LptC